MVTVVVLLESEGKGVPVTAGLDQSDRLTIVICLSRIRIRVLQFVCREHITGVIVIENYTVNRHARALDIQMALECIAGRHHDLTGPRSVGIFTGTAYGSGYEHSDHAAPLSNRSISSVDIYNMIDNARL